MEKDPKDETIYKAKIKLTTGGDYGYTFRVMPKHEMILENGLLEAQCKTILKDFFKMLRKK